MSKATYPGLLDQVPAREEGREEGARLGGRARERVRERGSDIERVDECVYGGGGRYSEAAYDCFLVGWQMVAGGQPAGMSFQENIRKESEEEASLPPDVVCVSCRIQGEEQS